MSIARTLGGFGTALLLSALATPALAGTSDALAGCKAEIANDARLKAFDSVYQDTGRIKRRGRFTAFEIDVHARTEDGTESRWEATCKARGNGEVESLELVHVSGAAEAQVAQSGK